MNRDDKYERELVRIIENFLNNIEKCVINWTSLILTLLDINY